MKVGLALLKIPEDGLRKSELEKSNNKNNTNADNITLGTDFNI